MTKLFEKLGKNMIAYSEKRNLRNAIRERENFAEKYIAEYRHDHAFPNEQIKNRHLSMYPHSIHVDFIYWYCNLDGKTGKVTNDEKDKLSLKELDDGPHLGLLASTAVSTINEILPYIFNDKLGSIRFKEPRYYRDKDLNLSYELGDFFRDWIGRDIEKAIFESVATIHGLMTSAVRKNKDVSDMIGQIEKERVFKNEFGRKDYLYNLLDNSFVGLSGLIKYSKKCASDKYGTLRESEKAKFTSEEDYINKELNKDYSVCADLLYAGKSDKFKNTLRPYIFRMIDINPLWSIAENKNDAS